MRGSSIYNMMLVMMGCITAAIADDVPPPAQAPGPGHAAELRFLQRAPFWGEDTLEPAVADPLPALQQVAALAEEAELQFLLVPIPPKTLLCPDPPGLNSAQTVRAHALLDAFFTELRARGIQALDLRPVFQAQPDLVALYTRTDTYWSGVGLHCAADAVAQHLRKRGWTREPMAAVTRADKELTFTGELARTETLFVTTITDPAGQPLPLDSDSSVLLLGDRQTLLFHDGPNGTGAGFPDHLARALGRPVDLLAAPGHAPADVRARLVERVRAKPKPPATWCIIWSFTMSDLTEAPGWDQLPAVND